MSNPIVMTPKQMRAALDHTTEQTAPQNIRYSKYYIQLACQKAGQELNRDLWGEVKAAIAAAGLTDSWQNIQDIDANNEELQVALPQIKQLFGEELTERVLREGVARD